MGAVGNEEEDAGRVWDIGGFPQSIHNNYVESMVQQSDHQTSNPKALKDHKLKLKTKS